MRRPQNPAIVAAMETSLTRLERATLEAYGSSAIAIFLAVLPMTWWFKVLLFALIASFLVDIAYRSPWTSGWSRRGKVALSVISVMIVATIGYWPVYNQYSLDNRPQNAKFMLSINSLLMCDFRPPWPPKSVAMILWSGVDNDGAPSVAKDWSLQVSNPTFGTQKVHFMGFSHAPSTVCGRHIGANAGLDEQTDNKKVVGFVRGRLFFVSSGLTRRELSDNNTTLTLSASDSAGHVFKTSKKIGQIWPHFTILSVLPPSQASPSKSAAQGVSH